jgi:NAD(P)-dependent dehydrogenase (short-subunit alcohol dehydrogenase family)
VPTNPRFDLGGRVAIITGGGKGIGKVYAQEFARAGAKAVAADIEGDAAQAVAEGIVRANGGAIGLATDVSDEHSANAMARARWNASARSISW